MTILENLPLFIRDYSAKVDTLKDRKLAFVVTGAAMEIFRLPQTPGASKVLEAIFVPYEQKQSVKFIAANTSEQKLLDFEKKAVSSKAAAALCYAGLNAWPDCKVIAVTGATTTNRPRKGLNQAYIAYGINSSYQEWVNGYENQVTSPRVETYHLSLPKVSAEEHEQMTEKEILKLRESEDRMVTEFALGLAFGLHTRVSWEGMT